MLCKICRGTAEPRSLYCKPCAKVRMRTNQRDYQRRRYAQLKGESMPVGHQGDRERLHLLINAARATHPFDKRVLDCAAALRFGKPESELRAQHGRIVLEAARELVR